MATPEGDADESGSARHRASSFRARHAFATLILLMVGGGFVWELVHRPQDDRATSAPAGGTSRGPETQAGAARSTVATILEGDAVRVVDSLTFAGSSESVLLTNPDRTGATASFVPEIAGVWVDSGSGGRRVEVPPSGESISIALPDGSTAVTIDYVATGVIAMSDGSAPGRALGLVTPLRLGDEEGPRSIEVRGPWVDNLGCVVRSGTMAACGTRGARGWETSDESGDLVDVVAQLTVPDGE